MAARISERPEYAALSQLLVAERERAGISQSELARRLNRTQAYVWKLENARQRPDIIELIDIAAILGTDLPELVRVLQIQLKGSEDAVR